MEKINIAELLRDCPKGMELECSMYDNLEFDYIDENSKFPIKCRSKITNVGYNSHEFTEYGEHDCHSNAKCVIFPKGKTSWEGFVPSCQFKDGDVVVAEAEDDKSFQLFLLKHLTYSEDDNSYDGYCYFGWDFQNNELFEKGKWGFNRLATEEEKAKLFKVIKDNGYHWNDETTTLEKLVESKEDTDNKIVMSGIYFDRENYADEVELHLGNYEIEVRDGKTYAVYKNQETKISKPIFKVGDKIKHKDTVLTIITVQTNSYIVEDEPDNFGILVFSQQDKWELINEPKFKVGDTIKQKGLDILKPIEITGVNPKMYTFRNGSFQYVEIIDKDYELVSRKFDIFTLKPFDKVLVRDTKEQVWVADLFSHMVKKPLGGYTFACVGHYPSQCIPYKGNEHLLGTTDDCDEYFNLIS